MHKKSGNIVALKIVPIEGEAESLKREIRILRDCKDEHIVKYYGSYYQNNGEEKNLWLVMEYCAAGSVIDVLRITKKSMTED